jgi:hypothetical protein
MMMRFRFEERLLAFCQDPFREIAKRVMRARKWSMVIRLIAFVSVSSSPFQVHYPEGACDEEP